MSDHQAASDRQVMSDHQGEGKKGFTSRWGVIATLVGLAMGTGNIWRFPREVALNGGGAFILAWTVMLMLVAVPLSIAEMIIGRSTRHGVPGAFKDFVGKKFTGMGIFMTLTVVGIGSYYTVVMAWILRYVILSVTQKLYTFSDKAALFDSVSNSSWLTVACFVFAAVLTAFICAGGVGKSIEKVQKFCVPLSLVLLLILIIRAVTLPNAVIGLDYLFKIEPEYLFNSQTWIKALVQILWSVGVGWGLVISYGVSMHAKSDLALNSFIQGFSDNATSIMAGMAILPVLFSMFPVDQAMDICNSGNNGLTFISLAGIFDKMPGGKLIAVIFFIVLFISGLLSNLGHFLVGSLPFIDAGWSRKKACALICCLFLVWGLPSALNIRFLENQDFVSGTFLVLGILFTCFAITKNGAENMRTKFINIPENDIHIGKWWNYLVKFIIPVVCVVMLIWNTKNLLTGENPMDIFAVESLGTLLFQLAIYAAVAILLTKTVNKHTTHKYYNGETYPDIPKEHAE